MSAERLREAAGVLLQRAEGATPGPWEVGMFPGDHERPESHRSYRVLNRDGRVANDLHGRNATYIATMAPPVALAAADWLAGVADTCDRVFARAEQRAAELRLEGDDRRADWWLDRMKVPPGALAVADAILGGVA